MKKNTSAVLVICGLILVATIRTNLATTTTTESFSPGNGTYTVSTHSGSSYDNANQAVLNAIGSTPSDTSGSGVLFSVACNLCFLWPPQFCVSYSSANQALDIDLRSYQSSNGYTKAWFEWVCHYSAGPGWNDPNGIWYGTPITIRMPLSLGSEQSVGMNFPNIPPPMPVVGSEFGYGGWGCKDSGNSATYPMVYLQKQTAEVKPTGNSEPVKVGEPIDVISGASTLNETDVVIPAPGIPLSFRRWYDSSNTNVGTLGKGWSCILDCSLLKTNTLFLGATNSWLVLGLDGQKYWKELSVTNSGHALRGTLDWQVVQETNGTYDAVLPQGVTYRFDTNGVLTSLDTDFGNHVSLTRTNLSGQSVVTRMDHNSGTHLDFTYVSNLLVSVSTPSTNLIIRYSYDPNGLLTHVTQTVATVQYATLYSYDSAVGIMTQRINAAGDIWAWGHNGNMTTNSYLGNSQWYNTSLIWNTNGLPQTTVSYSRDTTNVFYSYEYDPLRLTVDAIYGPNPDGSANWVGTRYTHDDFGNVTLAEAADWRPEIMQSLKVGMTYDSQNRLASWALGYQLAPTNQWTFSWNTNWATLASITDPEGHRLDYNYTNGLVSVERLFPATNQPAETHYAYTPNGVLASVTNANGHWVSYLSGAYGNPTQTISQAGTTNWMTWDILGHLKQIQIQGQVTDTNDPPNMVPRVITFDPNELGWVRKITYPDSTYETFAFDAIGNVTNHVDVAGRTTAYTWLPTRKLASTTRYLSSGGSNQAATVGLNYDQQMNVVNVKDELLRGVESYQLDIQDRPVTVTNVEGQVMKISWGLKDMANQIVRFDGSTNIFAYDEGQRVKQITYPDATISLGYYKNGLPMIASNCWGTINNSYDGANRLTAQTQPVPGGNVAYGYYPAGQVSNVVSVAGTNTYIRDAGERIQNLNVSTPLRQDSLAYSYDPINGMMSGVSYSNGIKCAYSYDLMDRLTGISWLDASNRVLMSRAYVYTPAGLISNITYETGEKAIYTYDSLDRLTREKHTDYYGQVISEQRYEYDLAGNRTRKTVLDGNGDTLATANYSLSTANRLGSWTVAETDLMTQFTVVGGSADPIGVGIRYGQLWVSNSPSADFTPYVDNATNFYAFDMVCNMGTQYIYACIRDLAGNNGFVTNRFYPTCLTNGAYQYNLAGCLTNFQYSGKSWVQSVGLTWNGQYQLTAASTNGVAAEQYGYDAAGRRIFIVQGGTTNWMVYDGNQVVAEVDGSGNLKKSYVYGPGLDNPISMTVYGASTNTYYYLKDHLGSVLALTDASGKIVENYRYDAWGRVLGVYNANGNEIDASAVGNRILWQGREYSWASGLYYFRARWYDPVTGRWLSNDPIGISGGLNQYVFCNNNPVNFRDLFGLCKDTMRELSWWEFNVKTPSRNIGRNVWNTVTDPTVAMGLAMVTEGLGGGLAILSEAGTVVETTTVAQDILSGAKTIGRAGNNSGVRVVESVDELNQAFSKLSQGGKVINAPGYKGTMVELVDGTRVGLRSVSKTGGPTIDIFGGGNSVKIHVGP